MARYHQKLIDLINARACKILTYAQVGLAEHQFKAFRALTLDELGAKGLQKDLENMLNEGNHSTENGNGRE